MLFCFFVFGVPSVMYLNARVTASAKARRNTRMTGQHQVLNDEAKKRQHTIATNLVVLPGRCGWWMLRQHVAWRHVLLYANRSTNLRLLVCVANVCAYISMWCGAEDVIGAQQVAKCA